MIKPRAAAVLAGMALCNGTLAHHGIVNFDLNTDIEIRGVITELAFVNPHSWLYLEGADESGEVAPWRCELRSATVLRRSGWSPDMFAAGTEITITGSPDRNEPYTCYLATIAFPDGTSMDRYGQLREAEPVVRPEERPARLANGDPNISGDWAGEQRVMSDPRGLVGTLVPLSMADSLEPGELPPGMRAFPGARGTPESLAADPIRAAWDRPTPLTLTETGQRAAEAFDPSSTDNPRLRCEPTNIIFDWTFDTPIHRITQHEDRITIEYGTIGGLERMIHLGRDEHPEEIEPSLAGHSIGRWENDVLSVETTGFAPGVLSADSYILHGEQLRIVEQFSLDHEAGALSRTYVAEDPEYFEGEFRGSDTVYISDLPFTADVCDDRSYRTDLAAPGPAAGEAADEAPAQETEEPNRPWWRFRD